MKRDCMPYAYSIYSRHRLDQSLFFTFLDIPVLIDFKWKKDKKERLCKKKGKLYSDCTDVQHDPHLPCSCIL